MDQPGLPLVISPTGKRRGRPPGAKSKRSIDLARYIEARFGNLTPGQVLAELAMPTVKEMQLARGSMVKAMGAKATDLADELKIGRADAMAMIVKLLFELAPYVHQKRAQAAPEKPDDDKTLVFMVPEGIEAAGSLDAGQADDETIEFLGLSE